MKQSLVIMPFLNQRGWVSQMRWVKTRRTGERVKTGPALMTDPLLRCFSFLSFFLEDSFMLPLQLIANLSYQRRDPTRVGIIQKWHCLESFCVIASLHQTQNTGLAMRSWIQDLVLIRNKGPNWPWKSPDLPSKSCNCLCHIYTWWITVEYGRASSIYRPRSL